MLITTAGDILLNPFHIASLEFLYTHTWISGRLILFELVFPAMAFQYENVILPDDEPVLLVNRDWQIPGRKPRKSKKGQKISFGRKVHSFKVKGQTESCSKIQLEPYLPRSGKLSSSIIRRTGSQRDEARVAAEAREREGQITRQGPPSDSPSSDGDAFQARLLASEDYDLVPTSQKNPVDNRPAPGIDCPLFRFTSYEVPDFIPKANYLRYYVDKVGDFLYPLKGMYTLNPLRSIWLPIILVDELWFYTILYTVARHLDASSRHRIHEREVTFLADAVFKRLRKRLELSADGVLLTDIDCAAVSCLLGVEHSFGTKEGTNQHAKGLAEFVKKRGGVNKISGVLRTKICKADLAAVIDLDIEPAIDPLLRTEPLAMSLSSPGSIPQSTMHPFYNAVLSHLSPHVAAIAVDFLALVLYLNQETKDQRLIDPFLLDNSVLNLQYRLVRCDPNVLSDLDQAFGVACLLFIKCLTRQLKVVSSTSNPLVIRLRRHIEQIADPPQSLLVWMLYMGLIAGHPLCQDRITMASKLVNELRTADGALAPWTGTKDKLQKVAWVEAIFDAAGEIIWAELDAVALV
jgi:hypothetical protein